LQHVNDAQRIFETIDARNDLAKTLVTHARLCQGLGNFAEARGFIEEAGGIFDTLGTLDEPGRVRAALTALDRGSPIPPLGGVL